MHSWLADTIITSVSYSSVPYFDFVEDIAAHIKGQNAAALVELVAVAAGSIVADYALAGNSPRWEQIGLAQEQVGCVLARVGFGIGGCPSETVGGSCLERCSFGSMKE